MNDEILRKSNQLGHGLARPNRDMLSLMHTRERMIKTGRFSEIEAIEREIE